MIFNSFEYLIFLPLVILIYFLTPQRLRWLVLLIASYYFYMSWNVKYVLLLLFFTIINFYSAIKIENSVNKKIKKNWLYFSLVSSFSLLFFFKYFNFFSISYNHFFALFAINLDPFLVNVLLPVGISFYTFQTIGYVLDVYWRKIKAERHIGIFALFVSFFPQLVAGPIERAKNLLPQFRRRKKFSYEYLISGFKLILWGFFLKVVIADRLAILVNQVYNNVSNYTGLPLILATYFFTFQIFGDFAGYSLIAIGSAKILGFTLMVNFKRPYLATSIGDFWRRWHISLSTWFKDYLYFPLGGSRVKISRLYFNLFIVFVVSGLWHGAAWTFVIWGVIHAVYMIFSNFIKTKREKFISIIKLNKFSLIHKSFQILITFNLVTFSWIFFRANSLTDAIYVITHLFSNLTFNFSNINLGLNSTGLIIAIASLIILGIYEILEEFLKIECLNYKNVFFRNIFFIIILYFILLFGVFSSSNFIYFQF